MARSNKRKRGESGESLNVVSPSEPAEGPPDVPPVEGVIVGGDPPPEEAAAVAAAADVAGDVVEPPVKADPAIVGLLTQDLWENDSRVVEDTLVKLANLCCQDAVGIAQRTANVTMCIRAGGQLSILNALKRFPQTADTQEYGCSALMNLCSESPESSQAVIEAGGIEVILTALVSFPGDGSLQTTACGALMNLVNSGCKSESVRQIHALNGIPVIVGSMKSFPDHPELQEYACGLIEHICADNDTLQTLYSAGGLSALSAAIEKHGENGSDCKGYAVAAMKSILETM